MLRYILRCVLSMMIISIGRSKENQRQLTLLNYNVWNYMFSWNARFLRIAQMIKENDPDIISLQEIYSHPNNPYNSDNQLQYLLSLLPSAYKYFHFSPNLNNENNSQNNELSEGLAIISKYPISYIHKYYFKERSNNPNAGDMNPRMLLKATIKAFDIYMTHLTYDKVLQCKHIKELLLQIQKHSLSNNAISDIFISGDLNVYEGYKHPMELLQNGISSDKRHNAVDIGVRFEDVFEKMESNETKIMTFSNMPWPGMVSRPDRLYHAHIGDRNPLQIKFIQVIGDGKTYKDDFYYSILWNRFSDALNGGKCVFDCGPNGYCLCGVCVKNPNGIEDEMKDCKSSCGVCSDDMHNLMKWSLFVGILHVIVYYGCIHGLYMAPRIKYDKNLSIPIVVFFVISLIICIDLLLWNFNDRMKEAVFGFMEEELFPSDHRGLVATFEYND